MIARLIHAAISQRFLVLLLSAFLAAAGIWAVRSTPIDALPDLSDVQVIIRTSYPGQAPQLVENQISYPIATSMMSVPGAKTVRAFSFYGDSFVYVIFEDGTDLYWARSRVLEYLSGVQAKLPAGAVASLGPDATGVGWIYEYALVDKTGAHDLGELRALQDWFLRYELKTLPNVAEVASIGGMVRQYQVVLDPLKMAALRVTQAEVKAAVQAANQEAGGGVLNLGEAELMLRANGYLRTLDDFRAILIRLNGDIPILLSDIAHVQLGPEMRRGVAELNGEGEVAGGVIILRSGKNARETLAAVQVKLANLQAGLPKGVQIIPTYERSQLIDRAVQNLSHKLIEEFVVVALVCLLFLGHLRSSLVAIITLPLGILAAFLVMRMQGVNANIMSLGGIAIAIGAMVDAAVVMIENAHKHIEAWQHEHPDSNLRGGDAHWQVIAKAAAEVGPALFFCLLIITLSFIPVFLLQAQEGRLFGPLAYTKTYAMAAAAALSITLVPVLMGFWIRGKIPDSAKNPLNRLLIWLYRPLLNAALSAPKMTLMLALLVMLSALWPASQLGGEFLPPLDEGDVLYMPSALPGLSAQKASELLQQTDRLIKTVPEVASVFGKAGRAETATDPAPMEMFETTVQFKPRDQWRAGMTPELLIAELDRVVQVPGLSNIWVPPIRNRIDMLATGIKSPIGVKVAGSDLAALDRISQQVAKAAKTVQGVSSSFAERLTGGRYVDIDIDRAAAARYGLSIAEVQAVVSGAIGGENIGEVVDGLARFPINLRYSRSWRSSIDAVRKLPILTPSGAQITLESVAKIAVQDGPPMLKSENARLSNWVYIDVRGRDVVSVVHDLQKVLAQKIKLEPGISLSYSGQFEFIERANAQLKILVPATLLIIFVLLYLTFTRFDEALLIMTTLPFALTGGVWLLYLLDYRLSVATGVGFIALAGVSAEFGVIMLIYLKQAWQHEQNLGGGNLLNAIRFGAVQRVRPKAMTAAVIIAGLLPMFWGAGSGSEIMRRIAAPMLGGMLSAPLLSLFVIPVAYLLMRRKRHEERL